MGSATGRGRGGCHLPAKLGLTCFGGGPRQTRPACPVRAERPRRLDPGVRSRGRRQRRTGPQHRWCIDWVGRAAGDRGGRRRQHVTVAPDRTVLVANYFGSSVTAYRPLMPFAAPGKVAALKVKGKVAAHKRKVSWQAPAVDGGLAVSKYRVVVKKKHRTLMTKRTDQRFTSPQAAEEQRGKQRFEPVPLDGVERGARLVDRHGVRLVGGDLRHLHGLGRVCVYQAMADGITKAAARQAQGMCPQGWRNRGSPAVSLGPEDLGVPGRPAACVRDPDAHGVERSVRNAWESPGQSIRRLVFEPPVEPGTDSHVRHRRRPFVWLARKGGRSPASALLDEVAHQRAPLLGALPEGHVSSGEPAQLRVGHRCGQRLRQRWSGEDVVATTDDQCGGR